MKIVRVLVIAALVAASAAVLHAPAAAQDNGMLYTCSDLNDPAFDGTYGGRAIGPAELKAGDTLILTAEEAARVFSMDRIVLTSFARQTVQIVLEFDGSTVATASFPGKLIYSVPNDITLTSVAWYISTEAYADWTVSCGEPGCDTLMPITEDAVVGAFVADALLYWAPGKLVAPLATITAGNTAWVLGVDSTLTYYRIVWVCELLWVPIGTMGPNYDKVWNGKPLPGDVVN